MTKDEKTIAYIDWEKCITIAQKRLQDVITAANKADDKEMTGLMLSSMCGEESDFIHYDKELVLTGNQSAGIYFDFNGYKFHVTKDNEFNCEYRSDLYHIWCVCAFFKGEELPMHHVHVDWLCGSGFLEDMHKAFIEGRVTTERFEEYLYDDVNATLSTWLEKNKEFIE